MSNNSTCKSAITKGQTLYFVPNQYSNYVPREVVVNTVGRVYFTVNEEQLRFRLDTMEADGLGYSSPGRCYENQGVYVLEQMIQKEYALLRMQLPSRCPDEVTLADLVKVRELLRLSDAPK